MWDRRSPLAPIISLSLLLIPYSIFPDPSLELFHHLVIL
jgi:hypothetical protein